MICSARSNGSADTYTCISSDQKENKALYKDAANVLFRVSGGKGVFSSVYLPAPDVVPVVYVFNLIFFFQFVEENGCITVC